MLRSMVSKAAKRPRRQTDFLGIYGIRPNKFVINMKKSSFSGTIFTVGMGEGLEYYWKIENH